MFSAAGTAGLLLQREAIGQEEGPEISPVEDLMREHGVLRRILLVYEDWIHRLAVRGDDEKLGGLNEAAKIVRSFIEQYHEKLEEDYVFPAMKKAGRLADLVDTLLLQHKAGRGLTEVTLQITSRGAVRDQNERTRLSGCLHQFIRMYRPHAAREDTVLFPAFRTAVEENEYNRLGDVFEKKEDQLFGEKGFARVVARVASIEKVLGIYDLARFTPA